MPRFPIFQFAHPFLRRHLLWIGLFLSAQLLAGFPGSGPMLTAEPGGLALQAAPVGTERIPAEVTKAAPEEVAANVESNGEAPQTAPLPSTLPDVGQPEARSLAWDGQPRTVRVPVLMYHYLSIPPDDANIYRRDLSVSPELFARQLEAIQAAGYTTISLYDLQAHLWEGAPLPEKPVVITFDDAYRDNYTNAFPLLRERGMIATIFVVTDFMDEERPAYMTWDMAREMLA
ncbi:MAG: hypothetical protein DWI57_07200, partial [Chloroflexi bacterium]